MVTSPLSFRPTEQELYFLEQIRRSKNLPSASAALRDIVLNEMNGVLDRPSVSMERNYPAIRNYEGELAAESFPMNEFGSRTRNVRPRREESIALAMTANFLGEQLEYAMQTISQLHVQIAYLQARLLERSSAPMSTEQLIYQCFQFCRPYSATPFGNQSYWR